MNKRGNFAFILILLITLFLIGATLFNFLTFKGNWENRSGELSKIIEERDFNHAYILNVANFSFVQSTQSQKQVSVEEARAEFKRLVAQQDFLIVGVGNFFGKVRNDDFKLEKNGEGWTLEIKNVFVQSKTGYTILKRSFDIVLKN